MVWDCSLNISYSDLFNAARSKDASVAVACSFENRIFTGMYFYKAGSRLGGGGGLIFL